MVMAKLKVSIFHKESIAVALYGYIEKTVWHTLRLLALRLISMSMMETASLPDSSKPGYI